MRTTICRVFEVAVDCATRLHRLTRDGVAQDEGWANRLHACDQNAEAW